MPDLVASDVLLKSQILGLQAALTKGFLRLYRNSLPPSPGNVYADFSEAYFTGYSPAQVLTWSGPTKVQSGEWSIQSPNIVFTCTSGPVQTLYGWFFTTSLGVVLSAPFTSPVSMSPGASLGVQLLVTEWATFLLRP